MSTIQFKISRFNELSAAELYLVLQLRESVFIVEQNCVYHDIDGKDDKALHVLGKYEDEIVAYARLFKPGDYFEQASIGRVLVSPDYRDRKWGHELMRAAIAAIESEFNSGAIEISAQLYLQQFYQAHGFTAISETYLEDDISHIRMLR